MGLLVVIYLELCNVCIQELELSYMQPLCCQGFSAAKILPNPKLEKERKNFIRGLRKEYGFVSQEFLVVRGNGWGFLWSGLHSCRW